MAEDWLPLFLAEEALPESFRETIEAICLPLAAHAAALHDARRRTVVLGLCGAQGSGKTTVGAAVARLLQARGLTAQALSLDDVYLSGARRRRLAQEIHPLLAARGPPGTHDVTLACATLDQLHTAGEVALPAFDKAADEPRPRTAWRTLVTPVDVVLFEGWCVGAVPEPAAALARPVNPLEAEEDPNGSWRAYVNAALSGAYQGLFARLDLLALLQAPSFEVVLGWRLEQEHKLIARRGRGMDDSSVARFIAHYERLTRWILAEMPARAGLVFALGPDRRPLAAG